MKNYFKVGDYVTFIPRTHWYESTFNKDVQYTARINKVDYDREGTLFEFETGFHDLRALAFWEKDIDIIYKSRHFKSLYEKLL